jgi:hypothetical protein
MRNAQQKASLESKESTQRFFSLPYFALPLAKISVTSLAARGGLAKRWQREELGLQST